MIHRETDCGRSPLQLFRHYESMRHHGGQDLTYRLTCEYRVVNRAIWKPIYRQLITWSRRIYMYGFTLTLAHEYANGRGNDLDILVEMNWLQVLGGTTTPRPSVQQMLADIVAEVLNNDPLPPLPQNRKVPGPTDPPVVFAPAIQQIQTPPPCTFHQVHQSILRHPNEFKFWHSSRNWPTATSPPANYQPQWFRIAGNHEVGEALPPEDANGRLRPPPGPTGAP
jgi:hypothetical protein